MAATSPAAGDALTKKLGPLPVWAWAGIGVALALFWSKKKSSSSSSQQAGSPFGYSTASQAQAAALGTYGSRFPIGYSDYSSGADLAGVLQQLSSQVSALGAGNSGTNQSPAVAPGSTQTGAANQTNPAEGGLIGAGFGAVNVTSPISTPSGTFAQIPGAPSYLAALQSGQPVYYQPAIGDFQPLPQTLQGQVIKPGTPYTNTPTFLKV